jgi:hypothetical protein
VNTLRQTKTPPKAPKTAVQADSVGPGLFMPCRSRPRTPRTTLATRHRRPLAVLRRMAVPPRVPALTTGRVRVPVVPARVFAFVEGEHRVARHRRHRLSKYSGKQFVYGNGAPWSQRLSTVIHDPLRVADSALNLAHQPGRRRRLRRALAVALPVHREGLRRDAAAAAKTKWSAREAIFQRLFCKVLHARDVGNGRGSGITGACVALSSHSSWPEQLYGLANGFGTTMCR